MPKIMKLIAKETKGISYNTFKYSFDSIGLPSIVYDDDSNKIMKWQDSAETVKHVKSVDLKSLADTIAGKQPLINYFLDGSRHVLKVDDIAYNKQVFPVVAGQIGVGCCSIEYKRKNWMMIDTIAGADSSAIIYSIAWTAKANNLNPYDYFKYLLTEIPKCLDEKERSFCKDLLSWLDKLA